MALDARGMAKAGPRYGAPRKAMSPDEETLPHGRIPDEAVERIKAMPAQFPERRSAVSPALDLVQEELGYLTPEAMTQVADALAIDPGYVEGVATFYSLFHLQPVGKHRFYMCTNVACMLRGAQELTDELRAHLGLEDPEDVTDDGLFSVEEVECLGCCEFAPVVRLDHRFHYDLDMAKLRMLVAERRGEGSAKPAETEPIAEPIPRAKTPRRRRREANG
jgi:NADH-quinone oxidoreductase subunit E